MYWAVQYRDEVVNLFNDFLLTKEPMLRTNIPQLLIVTFNLAHQSAVTYVCKYGRFVRGMTLIRLIDPAFHDAG